MDIILTQILIILRKLTYIRSIWICFTHSRSPRKGREGPYFVEEHSDSKNKYTENDIITMLEFQVDNIFVVFGGKVFRQIVGIPMGTNCAPLLADIFLYSYEAEFIQSLLSTWKKQIACQFKDKKEEIWPSPMTKAPILTKMSKGQSDNTNNATKKFD